MKAEFVSTGLLLKGGRGVYQSPWLAWGLWPGVDHRRQWDFPVTRSSSADQATACTALRAWKGGKPGLSSVSTEMKSTGSCLWSSEEWACVKGQKLTFSTWRIICAPFPVMVCPGFPASWGPPGLTVAGPVILWDPGSVSHCFDLSACNHSRRDRYEELCSQLLRTLEFLILWTAATLLKPFLCARKLTCLILFNLYNNLPGADTTTFPIASQMKKPRLRD